MILYTLRVTIVILSVILLPLSLVDLYLAIKIIRNRRTK